MMKASKILASSYALTVNRSRDSIFAIKTLQELIPMDGFFFIEYFQLLLKRLENLKEEEKKIN